MSSRLPNDVGQVLHVTCNDTTKSIHSEKFLLYPRPKLPTATRTFLRPRDLKTAQMAQTNQIKAADLLSVKGWVCLVTGGGTGIGLMCAQALAANGTVIITESSRWPRLTSNLTQGAKVYITDRCMEVLEAAASAHSPGDDSAGDIIP